MDHIHLTRLFSFFQRPGLDCPFLKDAPMDVLPSWVVFPLPPFRLYSRALSLSVRRSCDLHPPHNVSEQLRLLKPCVLSPSASYVPRGMDAQALDCRGDVL